MRLCGRIAAILANMINRIRMQQCVFYHQHPRHEFGNPKFERISDARTVPTRIAILYKCIIVVLLISGADSFRPFFEASTRRRGILCLSVERKKQNELDHDHLEISSIEQLRNQLQEQQQQIDSLLLAAKNKQALKRYASPPISNSERNAHFKEELESLTHSQTFPDSSSFADAPLKAMLFIDGTWLYYSIHERPWRDCPIIQKFGRYWQRHYKIDWSALPGIICNSLHGSMHSKRPLEIMRSSVYTSYKADTSRLSHRYQLFQDLKAANYDMHMMETVGRSEKCVDIQIAVELMHYATESGGAYDIGLLLTGDKDFMPAMVRTRQKGRAVGLVSMKRGCNRALTETPRLLDFDVIWLEDHLDTLIVPKTGTLAMRSQVSSFTLHKVVYDIIRRSGFERLSSRDVGRSLKKLCIGGHPLLDEIKKGYGGLFQFLSMTEIFTIENDAEEYAYWVSISDAASNILMLEARSTEFSNTEKDFIQGVEQTSIPMRSKEHLHAGQDFTASTVVQLKEYCRQYGLPCSGKKAILVERLESHIAERREFLVPSSALETSNMAHSQQKERIMSYLSGLIIEYLYAKGGISGSRDVGRYLVANKASSDSSISALKELKSNFGTLQLFALSQPNIFLIESSTDDPEFSIALREDATGKKIELTV